MGNKETKVDVDQFMQIADLKDAGRERSGSKQALAGCLASLSDMAATGVDTALPDIPLELVMDSLDPRDSAPPPGSDISPNTFRRISTHLRKKLEKRSTKDEEARKQLVLLDGLMTQEDSQDWASMRNWMVWCMHTHLDDDETSTPTPTSSGRRISRQTSMDATRRLQLNHQDSFDAGNSRMSAQSSLESNGET